MALTIFSNSVSALDGVQIYPQPAPQGNVVFAYDLSSAADVTIRIYDSTGHLASELKEVGQSAGSRAKTTWDASSFAPGLYFALVEIRETNGSHRQWTKELVLK